MQSVAQKKTHQNKYSKEKKTTKHTKRQKKINKYVYNNIMRRKNFCIYVTAEREIIFFFLICKIEEKRQPLSFYLFLSLLISFSLLLIPHKQITKNICQKKKMRVTSPVSSLHGFFYSLLKTTVTEKKKTKRYGEKVNFSQFSE